MITQRDATAHVMASLLDCIYSLPEDGPIFIEPPFITIPAGEFLMGPPESAKKTRVPEYQIAKYKLTNIEYSTYLRSSRDVANPPGWSEIGQAMLYHHPVVNVSWDDMQPYKKFYDKCHGGKYVYDLPSSEEWEKAARGTEDARNYPWGDEFDKNRCNSYESNIGTTTPVNFFEGLGDSPFGVIDMAGNVWEWLRDVAE